MAETSGGLTASALRKLKLSRETPVDAVLRELEKMGLTQPKPATNIKKFFADCEKADRALGLDFTRTDVFRERLLKAFPGMTLRKSDLLKGRYTTPQEIAALAP